MSMVIKMRIVNTKEFDKALRACVLAFGCMVERKRTLVHIIYFFEGDGGVIRDTLEEAGSKYCGKYEL